MPKHVMDLHRPTSPTSFLPTLVSELSLSSYLCHDTGERCLFLSLPQSPQDLNTWPHLNAYVDIGYFRKSSGVGGVKPLCLEGALATPLASKHMNCQEGTCHFHVSKLSKQWQANHSWPPIPLPHAHTIHTHFSLKPGNNTATGYIYWVVEC